MSPEPAESSRSVAILAWLEVHKKQLIVAAAALAVLIGSAAIIRIWRIDRGQAANKALLALQASELPGANRPRPAPQAYLEIAGQYAGTGAGARAILLAAEALFRQGQYAEGQVQFARYLNDHPAGAFAATAAYGIAASLDAQGKTAEAVVAYQTVLNRFARSPVADQARLALAAIHEAAGEPAKALEMYDDVGGFGGAGAWSPLAASRKEQLLRRHPELAPPASPPLIPSSTSLIGPTQGDLSGGLPPLAPDLMPVPEPAIDTNPPAP